MTTVSDSEPGAGRCVSDDDEPDPAVAALEAQIARMFSTARTHIRDRALQIHPELSPGPYSVFALLARSGPQHAGSLAAALDLDKSAVSRITKQLMELDLVERRPDPDDGRAYYLAATPHAVVRFNEVSNEQRRRLHRFLAGWDVADVHQFTALLARLNGDGPEGV